MTITLWAILFTLILLACMQIDINLKCMRNNIKCCKHDTQSHRPVGFIQSSESIRSRAHSEKSFHGRHFVLKSGEDSCCGGGGRRAMHRCACYDVTKPLNSQNTIIHK